MIGRDDVPGDHDDRAVHGDYEAYARGLEEEDDRRREIETAVAQAVAAEREACAAVAMEFARRAVVGAEGFARSATAVEIEQAIRARSKGGAK